MTSKKNCAKVIFSHVYSQERCTEANISSLPNTLKKAITICRFNGV